MNRPKYEKAAQKAASVTTRISTVVKMYTTEIFHTFKFVTQIL